MKKFYDLPNWLQWLMSIILLVVGFIIMAPLITMTYGLLFLPLLAPFLNLTTTPFFRLVGYYKYLNPYVISTIQNDKHYDLHNIFTFDYFVNFKWEDRGKKAQKIILCHYFKALLTIIERIENNKLSPEVNIVGHSYFFNERTAQKIGFTVSKAGFFWIINSALQFIELSYLYSFSQGKWSFPKFWNVKKAEISGINLVKRKNILKTLIVRLEASMKSQYSEF